MMNSKRGWLKNPESDDKPGLHTLRTEILLDNLQGDGPEEFLEGKYPTHNYIQHVLYQRHDLPVYTMWLTELVDDCARHDSIGHCIGHVELLRRLEKIKENIHVARDGLSGPQDDLRLQEDPFPSWGDLKCYQETGTKRGVKAMMGGMGIIGGYLIGKPFNSNLGG
ncbi:hypothetical protein PSPO01_08087 [Paraphaeosphaeria sporulosa]